MQEAEIVARAGLKGSVTISTNMAGRGTDIKLGEGVAGLGGLYVVGTERHEARRIDRQLRGRCARQSDLGLTLLRKLRGRPHAQFWRERSHDQDHDLWTERGRRTRASWLNKSVETAQKRVEQRNYMIRRRTLEFDDVMNQQREVIYGYRQEVMDSENPREKFEVIDEMVPKKVAEYLGQADSEEPDRQGLLNWLNTTFPSVSQPRKRICNRAPSKRTAIGSFR